MELRVLTRLAAALLLLPACTARAPEPAQGRPPPAAVVSSTAPVRAMVLPADDPYARAVVAAHARGLQVWLSADLVERWHEGRQSLRHAVSRLSALGRLPGVVGVKIADELGKDDGLTSPSATKRFLADSVSLLRASMPDSQVMVDVYVPQLGCGPGLDAAADARAACTAQAEAQYPSLTLPALDGLLATGDVDVLNLSTGLRDDTTYAGWGLTPEQVQRAAWQEVHRRGWDRMVRLQARKALAHEGVSLQSADSARRDVRLFIQMPLAGGAQAVDIWTWRQPYEGGVARLADPGPTVNALWRELVARHEAGDVLLTHFTPTSVEQGIEKDLDFLSTAFSGVLIAAGTG